MESTPRIGALRGVAFAQRSAARSLLRSAVHGGLAAALETYLLLDLLGLEFTLRMAFVIESVGSMFRLLFFAGVQRPAATGSPAR